MCVCVGGGCSVSLLAAFRAACRCWLLAAISLAAMHNSVPHLLCSEPGLTAPRQLPLPYPMALLIRERALVVNVDVVKMLVAHDKVRVSWLLAMLHCIHCVCSDSLATALLQPCYSLAAACGPALAGMDPWQRVQ
jgi:hypothetical protein